MNALIDVQIASQATGIPSAESIQQWIDSAISSWKQKDSPEICVRIVDPEESRTLNHQYRQKDTPTNVLSFPSELPEEVTLPLLGDLVVCAPVVAAEAEEQQKTLEAHWAHMIVHGTLHLLGYDHEQPQEAEIMEALETKIVTGLGYPAPYESNQQ